MVDYLNSRDQFETVITFQSVDLLLELLDRSLGELGSGLGLYKERIFYKIFFPWERRDDFWTLF